MKKKRQRHIGPRITLQLLLLLILVFGGIFLTFNLFFLNFFQKSVHTQLDAVQTRMASVTEGGQHRRQEGIPDLSHILGNSVRSEATVFNVDASYAVTDYDQQEDLTELQAVADRLRDESVPLDGTSYYHVDTESREYYISAITDPVIPDVYMVFALNVTPMHALWNTINTALGGIMAIAMLVCLAVAAALTRTVTVPVKQLSDFAERLGAGDFREQDLRYKDAEFTELASAMNQAAVKLDASEQERRIFFQNVSHELRTPLMAIRCYAEGISCGVMEPKSSGTIILSETDRLSEMVEDLLYISRLERRADADKVQENDLRETVSLCATSLRALAEKNGIEFCYEFDESPVLMTYNENYLFRAVNNLISNAIRYAKSRIVLRCRRTEAGAEIAVLDDGPGVSEGDLPHVFERFYKGPGGKAGIGLSIVQSVAELYGGTAAAEKGPGGKFTLRFP